jgi:hypothetical protein
MRRVRLPYHDASGFWEVERSVGRPPKALNRHVTAIVGIAAQLRTPQLLNKVKVYQVNALSTQPTKSRYPLTPEPPNYVQYAHGVVQGMIPAGTGGSPEFWRSVATMLLPAVAVIHM